MNTRSQEVSPTLLYQWQFDPNTNYFFRAAIFQFSDAIYLNRDQKEIDEAKVNILSGRYEINTKDKGVENFMASQVTDAESKMMRIMAELAAAAGLTCFEIQAIDL